MLNDDATLTLTDDLIGGNQASADGAGAGGAGGVAEGGGVFSGGALRLVNVAIFENLATAQGADGQRGGIANGGGAETEGAVAIQGSTFAADGADATGGQGAANAKQSGGDALGGGLEIDQSGPASVSASTFEQNLADGSAGPGGSGGGGAFGGGELIDGTGGVSETNVTFADNVAQATAGISEGGALEFDNEGRQQQPETLTNATLSGDRATLGDSNLGGEVSVNIGASVAIENTLISAGAGDAGSENCFAPTGALLSSRGHNIDSKDQCHFHTAGDRVNTSPLLKALADNGGAVATIALAPGSPAIDAGVAVGCPSTDARGVLRPAGAGCDIGAFEVATPSASTAQPSSVTSGSAVLGGIAANPDLAGASPFFQYGKTTAYGSRTPSQPVNATTRNVAINARPTGLSPATTYHYRIVVTNAAGTVIGADQRLTTSPTTHPKPHPKPKPMPHVRPRIFALKITPAAVSRTRGAAITYTDTSLATTTLVVQRPHQGRLQGPSCVSQTKRNNSHPRCTLWVPTGHRLTHRDVRGRQRLRTYPRGPSVTSGQGDTGSCSCPEHADLSVTRSASDCASRALMQNTRTPRCSEPTMPSGSSRPLTVRTPARMWSATAARSARLRAAEGATERGGRARRTKRS